MSFLVANALHATNNLQIIPDFSLKDSRDQTVLGLALWTGMCLQDENSQWWGSYDVNKIFLKTKQLVCLHVLACAAGEELSRRALDGSSYFKISAHIWLSERFLVLQLLLRAVLAVQWNSSSVKFSYQISVLSVHINSILSVSVCLFYRIEGKILMNLKCSGMHTIAAQLLGSGASINDTMSDGQTLLHMAIQRQDSKSALFLLEHQADINVR